MAAKTKRIVCVCGGGKVQHTLDDEGCWCPRCLQGKFEDRCKEFREAEAPVKPKVDRRVAPVGHRHPETAKTAARRSMPKAGTRRGEVYRLIQRAGEQGLTDDELEYKTGKSHQSVSATRNTLMNDGLIEASGFRRRTRWGNDAIAWKVASNE